MNAEVSQLVKAATSGSDAGQSQFAENLGCVLQALAPNVVRDELVPFLVSWLPPNNRKAVAALAGHMEQLIKAAGGLKPTAPVIERVVAVEQSAIEDKVFEALEKFKGDAMVDELVSCLVTSPFDCVRKFVVRVVSLASKEGCIEKTYEALVSDKAACVREAVARTVKNLKPEAAAKLVPTLVKDPQSRIRGFLANGLFTQPYFFDLVAAPLADDHDWSVRAALATSLGKSTEIAKAAPLCRKLARDGVWQVILCALRSLTKILTSNPSFEFSFGPPQELIDLLDATSRNPLKFAIIDCFFAHSKVSADAVAALFTRVLREPGEVKLRFLEEIAKRKEFVSAVEDQILKVVTDLAVVQKQWRLRLGVVTTLKALSGVVSKSTSDSFTELCVKLIDDEAYMVRNEALKHLAGVYLKESESIPELFNTLKADSFRKRQAAIALLTYMKNEAKTEAFKRKVDEELKPLLDDPISIVSFVAKEVLDNKSE